MKKLLVLLVAVCAVSVLAESTVLFVYDFETSEGYNAGTINGQKGWTYDWSDDDANMIINDSTVAASGSQYLSMGYPGKDARCRNTFDISSSFKAGNKLLVTWFSAGPSSGTHYAKFHNLGTSGQPYNVEIAELQIWSSTAQMTICDPSTGKTKGVQKAISNPTDFHEFTLLLEPSTHAVLEYTIDGTVVFDQTAGYTYQNDASNANNSGLGGDLIDGVRLQGHGAFDGFKVEMVPEPAIFGLIALLGLFFARKQR